MQRMNEKRDGEAPFEYCPGALGVLGEIQSSILSAFIGVDLRFHGFLDLTCRFPSGTLRVEKGSSRRVGGAHHRSESKRNSRPQFCFSPRRQERQGSRGVLVLVFLALLASWREVILVPAEGRTKVLSGAIVESEVRNVHRNMSSCA
jgi:hypothetical protein